MTEARRLDDARAHARAHDRLVAVVGCDCEIRWDADHCLQGHVDLDGSHLVVIAGRDDAHEPLVLTEDEWDAMRRGVRIAAARSR
jgi:hypothetical protein